MKISNWDKNFENNRTRDLKHLAWVPFPNKQDGDGYTELLGHPNGAAHFGAWCALVQVASKCDVRGTLLRDGGVPHDCVSLSRMTRIPAKVWKEALPRLANIRWIETCDNPAGGCDVSTAEGCGLPEQNRTELKEQKDTCPAGQDVAFWDEIKKLYTWVDVDKEKAKMLGWLLTPRGKGRKLTRRFVCNWLNKCDGKPIESAPQKAMTADQRYDMVLNSALIRFREAIRNNEELAEVIKIERKKHGKVLNSKGSDAISDALVLLKQGGN